MSMEEQRGATAADKWQVLLTILPIHYTEIEYRRERENKMLLLLLGILAFTLGQEFLGLSPSMHVKLILFGLLYIYRNSRLLDTTAAVITRINDALGLYEPIAYLSDNPLYPEQWRDWGSAEPDTWWGKMTKGTWSFRYNSLFVMVLGLASLVFLWSGK
jgi:hypothetical protein